MLKRISSLFANCLLYEPGCFLAVSLMLTQVITVYHQNGQIMLSQSEKLIAISCTWFDHPLTNALTHTCILLLYFSVSLFYPGFLNRPKKVDVKRLKN